MALGHVLMLVILGSYTRAQEEKAIEVAIVPLATELPVDTYYVYGPHDNNAPSQGCTLTVPVMQTIASNVVIQLKADKTFQMYYGGPIIIILVLLTVIVLIHMCTAVHHYCANKKQHQGYAALSRSTKKRSTPVVVYKDDDSNYP